MGMECDGFEQFMALLTTIDMLRVRNVIEKKNRELKRLLWSLRRALQVEKGSKGRG